MHAARAPSYYHCDMPNNYCKMRAINTSLDTLAVAWEWIDSSVTFKCYFLFCVLFLKMTA